MPRRETVATLAERVAALEDEARASADVVSELANALCAAVELNATHIEALLAELSPIAVSRVIIATRRRQKDSALAAVHQCSERASPKDVDGGESP